jgi:hypothetical protein
MRKSACRRWPARNAPRTDSTSPQRCRRTRTPHASNERRNASDSAAQSRTSTFHSAIEAAMASTGSGPTTHSRRLDGLPRCRSTTSKRAAVSSTGEMRPSATGIATVISFTRMDPQATRPRVEFSSDPCRRRATRCRSMHTAGIASLCMVSTYGPRSLVSSARRKMECRDPSGRRRMRLCPARVFCSSSSSGKPGCDATRATRRLTSPIRRWVSPVYRDYPDAEYRGR